jgi:hypothetical protein
VSTLRRPGRGPDAAKSELEAAPMQTKNKILDDISQLMTNAMGVGPRSPRGGAERASARCGPDARRPRPRHPARSSRPSAPWPRRPGEKDALAARLGRAGGAATRAHPTRACPGDRPVTPSL